MQKMLNVDQASHLTRVAADAGAMPRMATHLVNGKGFGSPAPARLNMALGATRTNMDAAPKGALGNRKERRREVSCQP